MAGCFGLSIGQMLMSLTEMEKSGERTGKQELWKFEVLFGQCKLPVGNWIFNFQV